MSRCKVVLGLVVVGLMVTVLVGQALSQEEGGERRGGREGGERWGGGEGGGPGDFNVADIRKRIQERMDERTKKTLGTTDEEWKVLQPKISKVQALRTESGPLSGIMAMLQRFGGGGDQDAADAPKLSDSQKATQELQKLLEDEDAKSAAIKEKLAALRKAREKAKKELAAAQKDLREVVTVRQEAHLVLMGMLD